MPPVSGMLTILGDDPRHAVSPTFANFVAISHVGSNVQFEFIFLDLNVLATRIQQVKDGTEKPEGQLQGKTVAKLVMPTASFIQLKDHLAELFERLGVKHGHEIQEKTGKEREYAQ